MHKVKHYISIFHSLDIWQKSLLILSTLFFALLFVENFIFSTSFSILHLREIDDSAFQVTLRHFHESISSLKVDRFIKLNDYGYGWIFWFFTGVLTYPFYLLAICTDFYVPLITAPRNLSLAMTLGSIFLVYKSLSLYTKSEFFKFISICLLISFPAFGYFALRFGTVAQVTFFSSLAFYLAASKDSYSKKDLKYIAVAAAACIGTKLNGALILPLISLIMADRLGWNPSKENFRKASYFLLNLIAFSILFSNPALFLSPFKPNYFHSYINSLSNNSHLGLQDNFLKTLQDVVEIGYLNIYVAVILVSFFVLNKLGNDKNKNDLFFIGIWLIFSISFLVKIMSMGTLYIINYLSVVMYLMVFGILYLERWGRLGKFLAVLLLLGNISLNHKNNTSGNYSSIKYFNLTENSDIIEKIESNEGIKKVITDPADSPDRKINVLMDYRATFPYANLERDNLNLLFVFNNLNIIQNQIKKDFDYISLNKSSPFFLSEEEFSKFIEKVKDESWALNHRKSRMIVKNLIETGELKGARYEVLFESNNIIFFGKK